MAGNTLGTSFKRFPRSPDGVFLQGETYLTDTLRQHYSLTNPDLASTTSDCLQALFEIPPDPLRQASQRVCIPNISHSALSLPMSLTLRTPLVKGVTVRTGSSDELRHERR